MGGLGLRCASRLAPAAYWASWADALPVLHARFPARADAICSELDSATPTRPCLVQAADSRLVLIQEGYQAPTFGDVMHGTRPAPPQAEDVDPGEWSHGWQYSATCARDVFFKEKCFWSWLDGAQRAMVRSQCGRNNARCFTAVPADALTSVSTPLMRICLQRRLRLPLLTEFSGRRQFTFSSCSAQRINIEMQLQWLEGI